MPQVILHPPAGTWTAPTETKTFRCNDEEQSIPYGRAVEVTDTILGVMRDSAQSFEEIAAPAPHEKGAEDDKHGKGAGSRGTDPGPSHRAH